MKGNPQFLKKLESGLAVVERRTKINSRNVGVVARHVPFVIKARANIYAA